MVISRFFENHCNTKKNPKMIKRNTNNDKTISELNFETYQKTYYKCITGLLDLYSRQILLTIFKCFRKNIKSVHHSEQLKQINIINNPYRIYIKLIFNNTADIRSICVSMAFPSPQIVYITSK